MVVVGGGCYENKEERISTQADVVFTNIALTSLAGGSPEPEGRFAERARESLRGPERADQMVHINQFELRSDSGHWHNTLLYFSLQ